MQTHSYKEHLHSPFDWYRSMRATQPVFKHPEWEGWQVFRYADVVRVLNDINIKIGRASQDVVAYSA